MKNKLIFLLAFAFFCQNAFGQVCKDTEPSNNSSGGADTIGCSVWPNFMRDTCAHIGVSGDIDWYKVTTAQSGTLIVNIPANTTGLIFNISIYNNSGTTLINQVTSSGAGLQTTNEVAISSGVYYVKINATSSYSTIPYELDISLDTESFETNNSSATATIIPINDTLQAKIRGINNLFGHTRYSIGSGTSYEDIDYYKVNATVGGALVINIPADSSGITYGINIYDSSLNLVNSAVSTGAGTALANEAVVCKGKYYILIFSYAGNTSAVPYTLYVNLDTVGSCECNNTVATAFSIPLNDSFSSKLRGYSNLLSHTKFLTNSGLSYEDIDYFKVRTTKGGVLSVSIPANSTGLTLAVKIYDSSLDLLNSAASSAPGGALVNETVVCSGLYYILINSQTDNTSNAPFTVVVRMDSSDNCECNNTIQTAYSIPSNDTIRAKIRGYNNYMSHTRFAIGSGLSYEDVDYYKVRATKGGVLSAKIKADSTGNVFGINILDSSLNLINSATAINPNDNVTNESLVCSGLYYVLVYSLVDNTGINPYTLIVTMDTSDVCECNNTIATAHEIPVFDTIHAKISGYNKLINHTRFSIGSGVAYEDIDYYKIHSNNGGVLTANIPAKFTNNIFGISIYDSSLNLINNATASDTNNKVSAEAIICSGLYYILVYSLIDNTNIIPYDLLVSIDTSDACECNNSIATAFEVQVGDSLKAKIRGFSKTSGHINYSIGTGTSYEDIDYYKIRISNSGVLSVRIPPNLTGLAYGISIYDSSMNLINTALASDTDNAVTNEALVCTGLFYILVYSQSDNTSLMPYTMVVNMDVSDVYECNNSILNAYPVRLIDTIVAELRGSNNIYGHTKYSTGTGLAFEDIDYYSIYTPRGGVLNIKIPSDSSGIIYGINIYDSSLNIIDSVFSPSSGSDVAVSALVCKGEYYIYVYSKSDATSLVHYSLLINFDSTDLCECNNSFSNAFPIFVNDTMNATIEGNSNLLVHNSFLSGTTTTNEDVDYYKFQANKNGVLVLNIPANLTGLTMGINVYDSVLNLINSTISLGAGYAVANETLLAAGLYYILVYSKTDNTSNVSYNLIVDFDTTDVAECNNTIAKSYLINQNISINAKLKGNNNLFQHVKYLTDTGRSSEDIDYYKVNTTQNGVLVVSIPSNSTGLAFGINVYDSALNLINNKVSIAINEGVTNESLVPRGQYYILVYSENDNTSSIPYTLNVSLDTSDGSEINNSFQTARSVPCFDTIYAQIRGYNNLLGHTSGTSGISFEDVDYYKVNLTIGGTLVVNIPDNSTGIIFGIQVFDSSLNLIYNATSSGTNLKVTNEALLCSGIYYIKVYSTTTVTSANPYIMYISLDTMGNCECNNSIVTAYSISQNDNFQSKLRGYNYLLGHTFTGFGTSYEDVDYYKINVTQDGVLAVKIPNNSTGITFGIDIYDSSLNLINTSSSISPNQQVVTETILTGGLYFVKVYSLNLTTSPNPYTLSVSLDISDACEYNNNFADACTIPVNDTLQAKIRGSNNLFGHVRFSTGSGTSNEDVDYYKVVASKGGVLVVNIPSNTTGISYGVNIYDSSFSLINSIVSATPGHEITNEAIVCSGVYFIMVFSSTDITSYDPYTLNVSLDTAGCECNNTFETACLISENDTLVAKIRGYNNLLGHTTATTSTTFEDVDYYKVRVKNGGVLEVNIPANASGITYGIDIYDSALNKINTSLSGGANLEVTNESLVCGGLYYIKIYSISAVTSQIPYTLNVSFDTTGGCECNNSFYTACLVQPNDVITAKIRGYNNFLGHSSGTSGTTFEDVDYYKVQLLNGGVFSATIPPNNTGITLGIQIYDTNQNLINSSISLAANLAVTTESILKSGIYYIKVYSNGANTSPNPYTLNLSFDTTDACETNNDFATACSISENDSFFAKINGYNYSLSHVNYGTGTGSSFEDIDFYKIHTTQSGVLVVNIPANNTGINFGINVYDSALNLLNVAKGSGAGIALNNEILVTPELIYIVVYSMQGNTSINPYCLKVKLDTSDQCEYNNTPQSACMALQNDTIHAKIRGNNYLFGHPNFQTGTGVRYDDIDYYKVNTLQDGVLVANIPENNTGITYIVNIYDSLLNLVNSSSATGPGLSVTNEAILQKGAYYVLVCSSDGTTSNNFYTLILGLDTTDIGEWNNSVQTAGKVLMNTSQNAKLRGYNHLQGHINYSSGMGTSFEDIDFYKVNAVQDGVLIVNIANSNTGIIFGINVYDSTLNLLNATQGAGPNLIAENDALVKSGKYYVLVYSVNGMTSMNPYSLKISLDNSDKCEFDNTLASACMIKTDDTIYAKISGYNNLFGHINYSLGTGTSYEDMDYYLMHTEECGLLTVSIPASMSKIIYGISVIDSLSGNTVAANESIAPGRGVADTITINKGAYYIGVYSATGLTDNIPYMLYTNTKPCNNYTGYSPLVSLSPNPNQGLFTINLSSPVDEPAEIKISNRIGVFVYSTFTTTNTRMELKLVQAPGIYFLSVTTLHSRYNTMFTITR